MADIEHYESEYPADTIFDGRLCTLLFDKSTERCGGDDLPNGLGIGPAYDVVSYTLTGMRIGQLELTRDQVAMIWGDEWIYQMEEREADYD